MATFSSAKDRLLELLQRGGVGTPIVPNQPQAPEIAPPEAGPSGVLTPTSGDPITDALLQSGLPRAESNVPPPPREGFFKHALRTYIQHVGENFTRPEREFKLKEKQAQSLEELRKSQEELNRPTPMVDPTTGQTVQVPLRQMQQALAQGWRFVGQMAGIASRENIAGAQIASREKIAGQQINSKADLYKAQAALAQAKADYEEALMEEDSVPNKMKKQQLQAQIAAINARIEQGNERLNIQREGQALQREKFEWAKDSPSPTAKGAADQGKAILDIAPRLKNYIRAHPENIGPIAGRITEFEAGLGTLDDESAKFYTELQSFYSAQGKLHGWRAIRTKEEFKKAINALARNPAAAIASIEAVENTARSFIKAGSRSPSAPSGGRRVIDLTKP